MQSSQSPFVGNIVPLANIITNVSGVDPTADLSNAVANIQQMVNTDSKSVFTNFLGAYTTGNSIQVTSPLVTSGGSTGGSTLGNSSNFITITNSISMGVNTSTIFQILSTGNIFVKGASEFRISSMTLAADWVVASTINVGSCYAQQFITLSDARAKYEISSIMNFPLHGINTYKFKYNGSSEDEIGLLAQELEGYPECISIIDDVKYVKYNAVVALLLGNVRELQDRVKFLESKQSSELQNYQ